MTRGRLKNLKNTPVSIKVARSQAMDGTFTGQLATTLDTAVSRLTRQQISRPIQCVVGRDREMVERQKRMVNVACVRKVRKGKRESDPWKSRNDPASCLTRRYIPVLRAVFSPCVGN